MNEREHILAIISDPFKTERKWEHTGACTADKPGGVTATSRELNLLDVSTPHEVMGVRLTLVLLGKSGLLVH